MVACLRNPFYIPSSSFPSALYAEVIVAVGEKAKKVCKLSTTRKYSARTRPYVFHILRAEGNLIKTANRRDKSVRTFKMNNFFDLFLFSAG